MHLQKGLAMTLAEEEEFMEDIMVEVMAQMEA